MNMQRIAAFTDAVHYDEGVGEIASFVRAEFGFALEERRAACEARRMVLEMLQREYEGAYVCDFVITDTARFSAWSLTLEYPVGYIRTVRQYH